MNNQLETASQAIIDLNQKRQTDLDRFEALKEEKEIEMRKSQTAAARTDDLTHEMDRLREDLSKQLKRSTVKAEAEQAETKPEGEGLRQQRFDDELREVTDKINEEWKNKMQSLEHEHEHKIVQHNKENALKTATLTEGFRDELDKEKRSTQDVQEDMTKELEKQANRHKEELSKIQNDYKRTLAESNQKQLTAQRERIRQLELKYQTELKKERKQRDGYIEQTMVHGSPDSSPEQVRHEAKVKMEIGNDYLKTQLTEQQQRARYLQSELEHQKELYGQLQIQVLAKHQLASLPSDGDVSYIHIFRHTGTCILYRTKAVHVYIRKERKKGMYN